MQSAPIYFLQKTLYSYIHTDRMPGSVECCSKFITGPPAEESCGYKDTCTQPTSTVGKQQFDHPDVEKKKNHLKMAGLSDDLLQTPHGQKTQFRVILSL